MYPSTIVGWLEKLVSFDTTSSKSNLPLVHFLQAYLESLGFTCVVQPNNTGNKANLFATLPASSNTAKNGGIILSGHLDTVPVEGQVWASDPFHAQVKDGRVYGRGTCDMKGFIAVALTLCKEWASQRRSRPVYLAWTYDEEVGCLGGRALTQFIKESGLRVDGCIVGEPTSNKIMVAHKGICVWRVRVKGKAVHSSFALSGKGCNAIDYAAKLIVHIRTVAEQLQASETKDKYFDVPYTSMSTNLVQGGNAINTVPSECVLTYEFRNLPAVAQESIQERVTSYINDTLLPQMRREWSEASITIEPLARVPHMSDADEHSPFLRLLRQLTGQSEIQKLGGGTEAGQYALINVPVVVCGPGRMDVAHQPNEYVTLTDLENCATLLRKLIEANQETLSRL